MALRAIRVHLHRGPDVSCAAGALDEGGGRAEGDEDGFRVAAGVRVGVVLAHGFDVARRCVEKGSWLEFHLRVVGYGMLCPGALGCQYGGCWAIEAW